MPRRGRAGRPGPRAAEVAGDRVVVERIGRRDRVGVAAQPLDPLRRLGPLPQADQPQAGDAPAGQPVELLVGDRVERPDVAGIASRQLVEPDIGALGEQDEAAASSRESWLNRSSSPASSNVVDLGRTAGARVVRREPGPVGGQPLLGQDVERDEEPVEQVVEGPVEQARPVRPDPAQLVGQRAGARRPAGAGARPASGRRVRSRVGRRRTPSSARRRRRAPVPRGPRAGRPARGTGRRRVLVEGGQQEELGDRGRWVGWLRDRKPGRELVAKAATA